MQIQSAGISINDHHTAAEAYMKFFDQEQVQRGGCPSDWVWLLPPISASLMPTFYQEMLMYRLRPSYEYQVSLYGTDEHENLKIALKIKQK